MLCLMKGLSEKIGITASADQSKRNELPALTPC